jgi:signal transduction histidine kinase
MTRLGTDRGRAPAAPRAEVGGPSVAALTVRVALAATGIVGVAFLVIATIVAIVVSDRLTADVDQNLSTVLAQVRDSGARIGPGFDPSRQDPRRIPVLAWTVDRSGTARAVGLTELALPSGNGGVTTPVTVSIDGASYRIAGIAIDNGRYVVGQALDGVDGTRTTLIVAEAGIGLTLLVVVFLGSVAIGRRVALPIERARIRQLEFTADASHELRTPLSVIEAQATLALARGRDPAWDAAAFGRIDHELRRTRRLVDDMLWLARFDSTGRVPESEPVDLQVLAAQTADRFAAVAEKRRQSLAVSPAHEGEDMIVSAPAEWLDRLVGVLLDNACKYSPDGGSIEVRVAAEGRRVRLTVDDSGPGIPPDERSRVFDRFHRATNAPGGAGLGLAIGDAIVRATGGRWQIGDSAAGGASISVSWPRTMAGHREPAADRQLP